jgi:hypothetical protein
MSLLSLEQVSKAYKVGAGLFKTNTKFAFSFKPAGAACNTRIAYFSSPTATPKLYALPSGACVERILKVY